MGLGVIIYGLSLFLDGLGIVNTVAGAVDRFEKLSQSQSLQAKKIAAKLKKASKKELTRSSSPEEKEAAKQALKAALEIFEEIRKNNEALVPAMRGREAFVAYVNDHGGTERREALDEVVRGLFDELLAIVADGVYDLATTDPKSVPQALSYLIDASQTLLGKIEKIETTTIDTLKEVRAGNIAADKRHTESMAKLNNISDLIDKHLPPRHTGREQKIRFGSPPGRAAGFISRQEQARLDAALGRPESRAGRGEALKPVCDTDAGHSVNGGGFSSDGDNAGSWSVGVPVVVCGMRGAGKSQLAAAYYRECEKSGWSLVAWMDASTREQAVAGLGGLAHEMGIDEDGKGDPEGLARRCVSRLNSGDSDRLIVFDNVKDVDDLAKLIPHSQGLRVLVTTTSIPDESVGYILVVGTFTRPQSVDFIRERTGVDDTDSTARLAEALGDLPVALAQAAGTIDVNGYTTIDEYLAELREYRLEEVVDRLPGDNYPDLAHAALRMAYKSALDLLEKKDRACGEEDLPRVRAASVQLTALALLAPSGVRRPWLHRIGTRMPIARQALTTLVAHSVCALSEDGRYMRIHGLQGRVLREDYTRQPEVFAELEGAVVDLLKGIDMDKADTDDVQRTDALDMADQLRAIAKQQQGQADYSPHEAHIDLSNIVDIVNNTIYCLTGMGRPQTALTLEDAVDMLANVPGPDDPDTLAARSNLARAHQDAGDLQTAINMYEALLPDLARILGSDHPHTLIARHNLARAHQDAGDLQTATDMYETVLPDLTRVLGPDHPHTLAARGNLAGAHRDAGHISTAIDMYEILLDKQTHVLGPDHPDTLATRGNLAAAYYAAGDPQKAIDIYKTLLPDTTRVLGPDHSHTLIVRSNLARAHQDAGDLQTATDMHEALLDDCARILGPDHPRTLTTRSNLADAHRQAGHLSKAIDMHEALLPDMTRILGPDDPDTLTTRSNLATAHRQAGHLPTAIAMYQAVLADCTRILGPDHPDTLATRGNLAAAYYAAGDPQKAIDIYKTLLPDTTRVLGPDHPDTLTARNNLAGAYYAGGDLQTATDMCEALLPDLARVLGPDHPYVHATHNNLAAARKKAQQASSPQADGEAESAPPPEN